MSDKKKVELEYILKASPKVLFNLVSTPDGLGEWFADNVNVGQEDIYTFFWEGSGEEARLLSLKNGESVKWRWLYDEEENQNTFFEFRISTDPMTKSTVFNVTDFAEADEVDETISLWESQISELRRILGA